MTTIAVHNAPAIACPDWCTVPADQHIADAIMGMDPLTEVAGSAKAHGAVRLPETPPLTALSPEMRAEVEELRTRLAKLEGGTPALSGPDSSGIIIESA